MNLSVTNLRLPSSLAIGIAGALSTAFFAGANPAGLAIAAVLTLVPAAIAWRARRRQRTEGDDLARHVADLQAFGDALAPVWTAQIEYSRSQMEDAITSLTVRFAEISARLDQTLSLSMNSGANGDDSAAAVSAKSERELDSVVRLLRDSLETKAEMLTKVQGLLRFVNELQEMARAIAQITQQTNLLAVNATIEAAHAGHLGRGFATVAQEVRALSKQSGETGARISEKISMIGAEIASTCAVAEETSRREQAAIQASEGTIHEVLAGFRGFADSLTGTTELLRHESEGIKGEVNEALVQLQFQDRVSQVMAHVSDNIGRLPEVIQEYGEECLEAGTLRPLHADTLLRELEQTYAMAEERETHLQPKQQSASAAKHEEITFF